MAEVAGSLIGIAAFGMSVAKHLHSALHDMRHAHDEIKGIQKNVKKFSKVSRHLGTVLKKNKQICTPEMIDDIRALQGRCRRDLDEIDEKVRPRKPRLLEAIRWFFNKSEVKEAEARFSAHQSILQSMIGTVHLSKMGDLYAQSQKNTKTIGILVEEIDSVKSIVVECHYKITKLQRAERQNEKDRMFDQSVRGQSSFPSGLPPGPSLNEASSNWTAPPSSATGARKQLNLHQSVSGPSSDRYLVQVTRDDRVPSDEGDSIAVKTFGSKDTSALLLQMIPYKSGVITHSPRVTDRLLSAGLDDTTANTSVTDNAVTSVKLLLDKWTTVGSKPLADILDVKVSEDYEMGSENESGKRSRNHRYTRFRSVDEMRSISGDSSDSDLSESPVHPGRGYSSHPYMPPSTPRPGAIPPPEFPYMPAYPQTFNPGNPYSLYSFPIRARDVWKSHHSHGQSLSRDVGVEVLNALRSSPGGISYSKSNGFQRIEYVDVREIYRFSLAPTMLISSEEEKIKFTHLGKGWVRKEVLDLYGYGYTEPDSFEYSIIGDLDLTAIEDMVVHSVYVTNRRSEEQSKDLIKERGWEETVQQLDPPQFQPNSTWAPQFPRPWPPHGSGAGPGQYYQPNTFETPPPPGLQPPGILRGNRGQGYHTEENSRGKEFEYSRMPHLYMEQPKSPSTSGAVQNSSTVPEKRYQSPIPEVRFIIPNKGGIASEPVKSPVPKTKGPYSTNENGNDLSKSKRHIATVTDVSDEEYATTEDEGSLKVEEIEAGEETETSEE